MENTASSSVKLPSLMSLDTSAVAGPCEELRALDKMQWRAECDRAKALGREARVTYYGLQNEVVTRAGGLGGVGGAGNIGEGRPMGNDDLVSVVYECICC